MSYNRSMTMMGGLWLLGVVLLATRAWFAAVIVYAVLIGIGSQKGGEK